jgi:hypothetical protein
MGKLTTYEGDCMTEQSELSYRDALLYIAGNFSRIKGFKFETVRSYGDERKSAIRGGIRIE